MFFLLFIFSNLEFGRLPEVGGFHVACFLFTYTYVFCESFLSFFLPSLPTTPFPTAVSHFKGRVSLMGKGIYWFALGI